MGTLRWGRYGAIHWLQFFLLGLALVLAACAPIEPSRWEEAQERTAGERATAKEAVAGGEFNKFFPQSNDDYSVVYTQEKVGFAEAVLKHEGEDVATLSVFDTVSNPGAAAKYQESTKKLGDYPVVAVGENGTGLLVADRFQVEIRSKSENFSTADRDQWLLAFNLDGLAGLE
jgi:hypothetical protein